MSSPLADLPAFLHPLDGVDGLCELRGEEAHHALHVLRMQEGDGLYPFAWVQAPDPSKR